MTKANSLPLCEKRPFLSISFRFHCQLLQVRIYWSEFCSHATLYQNSRRISMVFSTNLQSVIKPRKIPPFLVACKITWIQNVSSSEMSSKTNRKQRGERAGKEENPDPTNVHDREEPYSAAGAISRTGLRVSQCMWLHEAPDLKKRGARTWQSYFGFCVKRFWECSDCTINSGLCAGRSKPALALLLCRSGQWDRYGVLCCTVTKLRSREWRHDPTLNEAYKKGATQHRTVNSRASEKSDNGSQS